MNKLLSRVWPGSITAVYSEKAVQVGGQYTVLSGFSQMSLKMPSPDATNFSFTCQKAGILVFVDINEN